MPALHEIGLHKGRCPVAEERIEAGVQAAAQMVATTV